MNIFRIALVCALCVLMLGCGTGRKRYEAGLASLVGSNSDTFVERWGPPTGYSPLTKGGGVAVWRRSQIRHFSGYTTTQPQTAWAGTTPIRYNTTTYHPGGTHENSCEVMVTFSPSGIAEQVTYRGDGFCADWYPVPDVEIP